MAYYVVVMAGEATQSIGKFETPSGTASLKKSPTLHLSPGQLTVPFQEGWTLESPYRPNRSWM